MSYSQDTLSGQPISYIYSNLQYYCPASITPSEFVGAFQWNQQMLEGATMVLEKICIHCRGAIVSRLEFVPCGSQCSTAVCPTVKSYNDLKSASDDEVKGRGSCRSSQFSQHLYHHPLSKLSLNLPFFDLWSPPHGWGKQLTFSFVSSQAFYHLLGILLLLQLPIFTMSNPLPSPTGGESSHSSTSELNSQNPSPPHHRHNSRSHEREQKWINPCRIPLALPTFTSNNELLQTQSDEEIFHHVVVQATKAEAQALEFFKDFYREAFGGDPEEADRYKRLTYEFLTDVMDQVNNELTDEHFSTLQVDETIRLMYQGLQKFAVGLEAIVLDQACYGGSYYHHFNEAEFQLKYVLCELQIAMLEKNISHNDITREIMKTEYRDLADKTTRYIRDWTIFRDYVKTLRYVRHAFQYFRNRAVSSRELQDNN